METKVEKPPTPKERREMAKEKAASDALKAKNKERRSLFDDLDSFGRMFDREDTAGGALHDIEFIDVHLFDGSKFPCRLLEFGKYDILVEMAAKEKKVRAIVPKHAIKMMVLKE